MGFSCEIDAVAQTRAQLTPIVSSQFVGSTAERASLHAFWQKTAELLAFERNCCGYDWTSMNRRLQSVADTATGLLQVSDDSITADIAKVGVDGIQMSLEQVRQERPLRPWTDAAMFLGGVALLFGAIPVGWFAALSGTLWIGIPGVAAVLVMGLGGAYLIGRAWHDLMGWEPMPARVPKIDPSGNPVLGSSVNPSCRD